MDKDLLVFLVVLAVLVVIVIVGVFGCAVVYEYQICNARVELISEYQYKWVLWGGCLVKLPSGMWVNYEDAQFVELEKGR